jgi:hypothetical protein
MVPAASISSCTIPRMLGCLIELTALSSQGVETSCAVGASAEEVGSALVAAAAALGEVVWLGKSSSSEVPKDLLSLVWTDLAHRCSSRRYSLSSARFNRVLLPRLVHNLVRIVPNTLQRRSTEAELGQMEKIRRANRASGVGG